MKSIFIRLFLLCIIFCTVTLFFSQKKNSKIDSINRLIDQNYYNGNVTQKDFGEYVTHLYYLSKESKNVESQLSSIVEEARISYSYGDFNMALKKISEGVQLAETNKDYNILCHLLLVYQRVLLRLDRLHESESILKKCNYYNKLIPIKSDRDINDIYILLGRADHMVNTEGLSNHMNLVLSLKKQAYSKAQSLQNSDKYKKTTIIRVLQSLAWSQALAEKLPEARKNIIVIDRLLEVYPNEELVLKNYMIKGAVENIDHRYEQAIENFSLAIAKSKQNRNTYNLYEIYPMISASYGQLGDFKKAVDYSWHFKHLSDSIHLSNRRSDNSNLINTITSKIPSANNKIFDKGTIVVIIVFSLFVIFGSFLFFYKRKLLLLYHKFTIRRDKTKPKTDVDGSKPVIVRNLVELAKQDINTFYVEFHHAYPTFHQDLKEQYPELTIYDLNFCSLVKMNFESKQIALFTNTTIRSAESRRYRILKKMDIKSQSELYIMMSQLT
ncbi:tetratricopeptide repeat protein [Chryseobacterium sp. ERMR1:04]|uniref:tetratricopeptide repeat protein n=1 Tax=Chryseobacterium sp. ERMR1:04 TaxID=1705393 RepID=UPI0006C8CBCC|nr:tetratricopeptide repeat protein [Chryseobacterium sp. ERMR1:04]KPH14775.1 hypothetical protein AMQ68_04855 [Chryseobacterium sp. ERMR1:04]